MPAIADPPAAAPNAAPPTPAPRQPPDLKPVPQPAAKSAREARGEALSSWMGDLGTLEPTPDDAPPGKPAIEKPAPAASATAPAAQPAAKPADKPTPDDAPPSDQGEDKWPRSSSDWKRFIEVRNSNYAKRDARIKELETTLAEREAKLSAFKDAVDPKEHETVRSERDKLSETLRLAAVEKHPRFVQYYDGKVNAQVELAKRLVGGEKAEAVATLLKAPDTEWRSQQLEALMGDLTPMQQSRLGSVLNSLEEIRAEREGEVARAREDYEKATTKAQAEAKARSESARSEAENLFGNVVKAAQAENPIFQPRDGDEAWNKAVAERVTEAKRLMFEQHKPDVLAKAALNAVAYPALLESYQSLLSEIDKLKAQVTQLSSASPGIARREGERANGHPAAAALPAGSRPMAAAKSWMDLINQPTE